MAECVLQRVVLPLGWGRRRLYYRENRAGACRPQGRCGIVLPRAAFFRTDAFFNAFYECYWRRYTSLQRLALRIHVQGEGVVRLYRRTSQREKRLLHEVAFSGAERELRIAVAEPSHEGLLYFEVEAYSARLRIHRAEWIACDTAARRVRLAVGVCTFNRASQLLRNLNRLFRDRNSLKSLERVYVVDQGSELMRDQPAYAVLSAAVGERLQVIEQDNCGGAGGFTRCLLEAQNDGIATHVLLMDDDIVLEPESVARAAAFLSLARGDVGVGGHMLDRYRPRELVESGSRFLPTKIRIDEPSRRRVDRPDGLVSFLEPEPKHYSGWWFFAFPIAVLERAGLPMPLFLRGDDVEFGCRLLHRGIPTVALPGVAVWHEPFESKGRSWQPYYELRNLLIVGALHFPHIGTRTAARQFFSRLLDELLAYDYYESWLLCEAVAAYLRGPTILYKPDLLGHHRLADMQAKLTPKPLPRDGAPPLENERLKRVIPTTVRWQRWRLVLCNLLRASPSAEAGPQRTLRGGEQWYEVADVDVVTVDESHRSECVVLRRSRSRFVRLLLRGVWLGIRLLICHCWMARKWRAAMPTLTSQVFWKKYLNMSENVPVRASSDALPCAMHRSERQTVS